VKKARGSRPPKSKVEVEIKDAFWIRLIAVDEVNDSATLEICLMGNKPQQIFLDNFTDSWYADIAVTL